MSIFLHPTLFTFNQLIFNHIKYHRQIMKIESFWLFKPIKITQNWVFDMPQSSINSITRLSFADTTAYKLELILPLTHANYLIKKKIVIQYILNLNSWDFPPRLRGVEEMTNRLLSDRDASPVGKRWATKFVKWHKDLDTRFLFVNVTINKLNAKIQLLLTICLGLYRIQSQSTGSIQMISITLMRLTFWWA